MGFLSRFAISFLVASSWLVAAELPDWKVRTGAGDQLELSKVVAGNQGTLLAIVAATTQDSGQAQLKALLGAHQQLASRVDNMAPTYHLNIIAGAPRLVQGFIRRGIAGEYQAPVTENTVLLAFTDSNDEYIAATGLAVDDIPTWLWVDSTGAIVSTFKMNEATNTEAFVAWYLSL